MAADPAPAPAPVVSTSSAAANAAAPADASNAGATDMDKDLLAQGYRLQVKHGQRLYCRTETPLGTRFGKRVCQSPENIAAATERSQDATKSWQKTTGNGVVK